MTMHRDRAVACRRSGPLPALRIAVSVLAVSVLAACAALPALGPQADTFDLTVPDVDGAQPVRRGTQILIAEPAALKALDSENIVVEATPLTIQYLGAAQWSDRLPRLVQRNLAAAFEGTGRFAGVGLPGQGLAIDYQIVTDIRAFGIDLTTGTADVRVAAKLLNDRNGEIVSDRVFTAQVPVPPSAGNEAYVAAINQAFGIVADDLVVWVTGRI